MDLQDNPAKQVFNLVRYRPLFKHIVDDDDQSCVAGASFITVRWVSECDMNGFRV